MRALRWAAWWQAAGFIFVAATLLALLLPSGGRIASLNNLDKLVHAVGFFGLTMWFAGIYRRNRYALLAAGMLAFGALTEWLQSAVTRSRSGDPMDLLADAVGITLAIIVACAGGDRWCAMVERWLA